MITAPPPARSGLCRQGLCERPILRTRGSCNAHVLDFLLPMKTLDWIASEQLDTVAFGRCLANGFDNLRGTRNSALHSAPLRWKEPDLARRHPTQALAKAWNPFPLQIFQNETGVGIPDI